MATTTRKDFDYFNKRCRLWADWWGLTEWDLRIKHDDADDDCEAACWTQNESRIAQIFLNSEVDDRGFDHIDKLAFHEICELLLADLRGCAYETVSQKVVEKENHNVVNRLENAVFPVVRKMLK